MAGIICDRVSSFCCKRENYTKHSFVNRLFNVVEVFAEVVFNFNRQYWFTDFHEHERRILSGKMGNYGVCKKSFH